VDRCALFVDAGYVLADGAMAVHGTRRRESVSWDYAGLLQLLTSLARERSGLPLLRCYWYEATVEGRRSADHDALADLPGVKLRVAKMRPGRREGVEGEIHRDLTTLARNKAVSDAMVISAEEDLTQVIADVQDLGLRVTLLHIAVDGNWTISRALRQECDDIVEIGSAHLRPYVELISGAEPPYPHERDSAPLIALRPTVNGNGQLGRTAPYAAPSSGPDNGHQVPPSIYTAPVVAEYQRSAPPLPRPYPDDAVVALENPQAREPDPVQDPPGRPTRADRQSGRQDVALAQPDGVDALPEPVAAAADYLGASPDLGAAAFDQAQARQDPQARQDLVHDLQNAVPTGQDQPVLPLRGDQAAVPQEPQPAGQDYDARPDSPMRPDAPVPPEFVSRQELYAAPVAVHAPAGDPPVEFPALRSRQAADLSGYNPGAIREQLPWDAVTREPPPGEPGDGRQPVPVEASSAQIRHLPTRGGQSTPAPGQPLAQPSPGQPSASAPTAAQPAIEQPARNGSYTSPRPVVPAGPGPGGPVSPGVPAGPAAAGAAMGLAGQPQGPQSLSTPVSPVGFAGQAGGQPTGPGGQPPPGPAVPARSIGPAGRGGPVAGPGQGTAPGGHSRPVGPVAYPAGQPAFSLGDAVQSAHAEGQAFGESVARDAPALWLEAVLARKPRMPSDLEARLLQGSALPIDFLLHDEVRHALRRGFWDALERARR
jgi:hypothetical protein